MYNEKQGFGGLRPNLTSPHHCFTSVTRIGICMYLAVHGTFLWVGRCVSCFLSAILWATCKIRRHDTTCCVYACAERATRNITTNPQTRPPCIAMCMHIPVLVTHVRRRCGEVRLGRNSPNTCVFTVHSHSRLGRDCLYRSLDQGGAHCKRTTLSYELARSFVLT